MVVKRNHLSLEAGPLLSGRSHAFVLCMQREVTQKAEPRCGRFSFVCTQWITDLLGRNQQGCVEEPVHFLNSSGKPHNDHNSKDTLCDLHTSFYLLQALFLCYMWVCTVSLPF